VIKLGKKIDHKYLTLDG